MPLPLLQTKLYVPPSRQHLVARPAVTAKLGAGLQHPITLIAAPAGFGKTTLISAWISQSTQTAAWLALDEDDNDPVRFLTYMIAALQTQQPQLGVNALGLLAAPQAPPPKAILTLLLNDLGTLTDPLLLVLDDYHVITTPAIHEALTFFVEHLPSLCHLIITSRIDPPLPLARWRARNKLAEIRAQDLRFRQEEAAIFFNEVMGLTLTTDEIATLETRTEGWIAGLQLAALSLQGRPNVASFIEAFSGSHRHVLSYLVEEVLNRCPPDTLSFLLQSSILNQMCAPLCDAVTGESEGQASLAKLEQANLFLIPLDDEGKWYRYHHLFAEVLHSRLQQTQPALVLQLHERASAWYEQQTLWSEAIHHALAAHEFVLTARLIEQVGIAHFGQMNIQHSLNRWLAQLPDAIIHAQPRLCLIYAWSLFVGMDFAGTVQWVVAAEAALQRTPAPLASAVAGEIAAIRAMQAAYNPNQPRSEAIIWGRQALATLSADQATFRGVAALSLGMAAMKEGDIVVAEQALTEANRMGRVAGNVYSFVAAAANQVVMQRALGTVRLAQATCQEALAWVAQRSALAYPIVGSLYLNLADLLRERNDLDPGERHAQVAIVHSDRGVNRHFLIISRLVLLRVKQAQGDWGQAWALLREVATLAEQHPNIIHNTLLPAITAQFQVTEVGFPTGPSSALIAAYAWAQSVAWEEGQAFSAYNAYDFIYMLEHSRLARAQVFIAWARATIDRQLLPETLAYLARQQQIAEAGSLRWFQIKVCLLQALAHHALGDTEQAQTTLTRALHLAEPEGFVRIFVDEGEPIRLLILDLRFWIAQQPQTEQNIRLLAYTDKLLINFGDKQSIEVESLLVEQAKIAPGGPPPKSKTNNLVEPLSARELEVLRLAADGYSNTEIAARLIVATSTVKTHINRIFSKLAVQSRTRAVAQARELGLL